MAATKNIESKTLHTVDKNEDAERGRATIIRVVDWITEGKHYPQLEKREFFKDEGGNWKMGKAKGFNMKDLGKVQDQWDEITKHLGGQAGAQSQQQAAPVAASTTKEEEF